MKENEKKVSFLVEEGSQNKVSNLLDDKQNNKERLKKPLIFSLMAVVFFGCMYLIFKPSTDKTEIEKAGLNDVVPQATGAGMPANKGKAYEQEMLNAKEQEKRNALLSLSDYWNTDDNEEPVEVLDEEEPSYSGGYERHSNPALNSYHNAQSTLGSFYQGDDSQTLELQKQLDELKEQLAEKEVPSTVTVENQLALMEKSYQMAAKYLPSGTNGGEVKVTPASSTQKESFVAFTSKRKNVVSALYREPTDSAFVAYWSENRNRQFYTPGSSQQAVEPKNSIKACVHETQTITGESFVHLRLLEPAQTPNRAIEQGTILTAHTKFQAGRLQLKVTSMELDGNIIPVDITIYDLDGQEGLYVPYSPEINALTEMAGNMSQTSGTSLMLTQSAGQQVAADLSRGVVQGISGYFSKKIKTPKITLKAGHLLFLVSKK